MKGCFVCEKGGRLPYTYGQGRMERVREKIEMCPEIINEENIDAYRNYLQQCEVIFCAWDMLTLTEEQIAFYFPKLKVIFYAAGSVQYFARPFLRRGVTVLSAWRIMSRPVAQFAFSLIMLAGKGALLTLEKYRREGYDASRILPQKIYPGIYGTKIGILGAGSIGSLVIDMLKGCDTEIYVYDPYLEQERAEKMGVEVCSLEKVFGECQVISNHLANNPQTVNLLDYHLFERMKDTAAFINTGRGAQVVEKDLIRALREQPLRSAYLDVTEPEPVEKDHPFWEMPNVFLFPHIAGSARDEVLMFPDFMLRQLDHYLAGEPFDNCEVTMEMLKTMA